MTKMLTMCALLAAVMATSGCMGMKLTLLYDDVLEKGAQGVKLRSSMDDPLESDGSDPLFTYLENRQPEDCHWMVGQRAPTTDQRLFLCCDTGKGPVCREANWVEKEGEIPQAWPAARANKP